MGERTCKGISMVKSLSDYTVIDLETTDRDIYSCEVIELSAIKIRNGEIVDTFSSLVKPLNKIPYFITIH